MTHFNIVQNTPIPFLKLNENILPLDNAKLNDFRASVYSVNPTLIILNETRLTSYHSDNEILSNKFYKLHRLDRSESTHPFDPLNPTKFRKKGGGILIGVRTNVDIQSKVVGKRVKAEILSVEIKCGNDIFCLTTCYRVGNLGEENFKEISSHLNSINKIKKYKKHFSLVTLI